MFPSVRVRALLLVLLAVCGFVHVGLHLADEPDASCDLCLTLSALVLPDPGPALEPAPQPAGLAVLDLPCLPRSERLGLRSSRAPPF